MSVLMTSMRLSLIVKPGFITTKMSSKKIIPVLDTGHLSPGLRSAEHWEVAGGEKKVGKRACLVGLRGSAGRDTDPTRA